MLRSFDNPIRLQAGILFKLKFLIISRRKTKNERNKNSFLVINNLKLKEFQYFLSAFHNKMVLKN